MFNSLPVCPINLVETIAGQLIVLNERTNLPSLYVGQHVVWLHTRDTLNPHFFLSISPCNKD